MTYQEITTKIEASREAYRDAMNKFLREFDVIKVDKEKLKAGVGEIKEAYGKLLSETNTGTLNVVEHLDRVEEKDNIEDFEDSLVHFLSLARIYHVDFGKQIKDAGYADGLGISERMYKNLQKYFNTFSSPETITKTKDLFTQLQVDMSGYDSKFEGKTDVEKRRKLSIIVGGICSAVVITILLSKDPPYSGELSMVLKIFFCIGAAGISAALLGTFRWKLLEKVPVDLVGGIGFAVFLLLKDIKPWSNPDPPPPPPNFRTTIVLKDKNDNDVSGVAIKDIALRLGDDRDQGKVTANNSYEWQTVPRIFADSLIEVQLVSDKWAFEGGRKSKKIKLAVVGNIIPVVRDSVSLQVWGTINFRGQAARKRPKVEVYVKEFPGIRCLVDTMGTFRITVPEEKDRGVVRLIFTKNGAIYMDTLTNYGLIPITIK